MKPTLKVTGRGRLSLTPDMIRIRIEQTDTDPDYSKVIRESTAHTEELRTELTALGFDEKALKTLNFNVSTEYEGYQDSDMIWKQRFKGYTVRHSMKVEFSRDDELMAKVLYRISCLSGKPEFHIEYTVRDTEEAKKNLLEKAVQDAREKAEILAKASKTALLQILSIDYSFGDLSFSVQPVNRFTGAKMAVAEEDAMDFSVEPENIDVTDTVTITWQIQSQE